MKWRRVRFVMFEKLVFLSTSASCSAAPFSTLTVRVTMGSPPFCPDGYSVTSTISVTIVSVTSVTSVTSRDAKVFQDQGLPSLESLLWKLALLSAALLSE